MPYKKPQLTLVWIRRQVDVFQGNLCHTKQLICHSKTLNLTILSPLSKAEDSVINLKDKLKTSEQQLSEFKGKSEKLASDLEISRNNVNKLSMQVTIFLSYILVILYLLMENSYFIHT